MSSGQEIRSFKGDHGRIVKSFSSDGKLVLSGDYNDSIMKLWNISNGQEIPSFQRHSNDVRAVAFSPDNKLIISGGKFNTMKLWNALSGEEIYSFQMYVHSPIRYSSTINDIAFSPNSKLVLSGGDDDSCRLWSVKTGKEIAQFFSFKNGESVSITPEGYYIASSPKAEQRIKVRIGKQVHDIDKYRSEFNKPEKIRSTLQSFLK